MDAWYQCENPYPFVPQDVLEGVDSVRASLPNSYCDPKIAADLFEEVLTSSCCATTTGSTCARSSTTPASTRCSGPTR